MIDSFCDLLGYYEMVKKVTNQSSENGTLTIEVFHNIQVLLEHNLENTCAWVSLTILNSVYHQPSMYRMISDIIDGT